MNTLLSGVQITGEDQRPDAAVRVSTVDNFQGEEARIIIASLVRSNAAGKIGFLYEPQRVNVLLSRARDALILVGNPHCLCGRKATRSNAVTEIQLASRSPREPQRLTLTANTLEYGPAPMRNTDSKSTWEKVLAHVKPLVGFPARCQQHGQEVLLKTPQDFETYTPDGGCTLECGAHLPCGHACGSRCHAQRQQHAVCREMIPAWCASSFFPSQACMQLVCTVGVNVVLNSVDAGCHRFPAPLQHGVANKSPTAN